MLLQPYAEFQAPYPGCGFSRQFNLFQNQAAPGSSLWVPAHLFSNGTIEIQSASLDTGVFQLFGTMVDDPIAPPTGGFTTGTQIGTNTTLSANGFIYILNPYKYIRLNLLSIVGGAASAILLLASNP